MDMALTNATPRPRMHVGITSTVNWKPTLYANVAKNPPSIYAIILGIPSEKCKNVKPNIIRFSFDRPTPKDSRESYDDGTHIHAQKGWPASAQEVDAKDGEDLCGEVDGGHGHEGEIELKVQVGDVPDTDGEDAHD